MSRPDSSRDEVRDAVDGALRADVSLLGSLLGRVLDESGGEGASPAGQHSGHEPGVEPASGEQLVGPSGVHPQPDREEGQPLQIDVADVVLPKGASVARTDKMVDRVGEALREIPSVEHTIGVTGRRPNARSSSPIVSSFEPSLTTTTSSWG